MSIFQEFWPALGFMAVPVVVFGSILFYILYRVYGAGIGTKLYLMAIAAVSAGIILAFTASWYRFRIGPTIMGLLVAIVIGVTAVAWMYRYMNLIVKAEVSELVANAAQLSTTARQSSLIAAEQSSTVTNVTTSVDEATQMSKAVSDRAQEVAATAKEAKKQGEDGLVSLGEALRILDQIAQTEEIITTVNNMAEQSNLLALNASIEAARAGDSGRGFAVVAAEVRNLSGQSKEATGKVRTAILSAEEGRLKLKATDEVLHRLASALNSATDKTKQISASVLQQAAGLRQISEAMVNVSEGGRDSAVIAQQVESAATALQQIASRLSIYFTGKSERRVDTPSRSSAGPVS